MKRTYLAPVLVGGLVVLGGIGMALAWPRAPLDAALTVPAVPPTRLVCYGYVDRRQGPLLLQPTRPGRVVQVFVKEGQTISKDTPLLQLDDRLVKRYEEEAALAVQAAQLQLAKAEHGQKQYQAKQAQGKAAKQLAQTKLRAAEHYLKVKEDLLKEGAGNEGQIQLARDQVADARILVTLANQKLAELDAIDPAVEMKLAQVQLDLSQAQLRRAVQEREEMELKAPTAGTILRVSVQDGDLVAPTSPHPPIWLLPAGAWIVRGEVAQEFAGRVQVGQAVRVEDEASGAVLAHGRITEAADYFLPRRQLSADPAAINTGVALECIVSLDAADATLRLGQRVRVRVLADETRIQ